MKNPATLAWIALALVLPGAAAADKCTYAIDDVADDSGARLRLTKTHALQDPINPNYPFAVIAAGRISHANSGEHQRYLRITFTWPEFVMTEKDAVNVANITDIEDGAPLTITFVDGSTITLIAKEGGRGKSRIDRPGELFNTTDRFRVSTIVGATYWVDEQTETALMAQPVTHIRTPTTQGTYEARVQPAQASRVPFVLGCV